MLMKGTVQRLVDEYLTSSSQPSPCRMVALRGAVPVSSAWSGCFGVFDDGSVIYYDEDTNSWAPQVRRDEWLATVTFAAAQHPELAFLVPVRPSDAVVCPACSGKPFFGED